MTADITAIRVKRVRDADGASCPVCGTVFGKFWWEPVPWNWRQSQAMHESGSGHKMELFRVAS